MNPVLLTFRLIIAGVFFTAGFAKLADPEGSENALTGFGVPTSLAKTGAKLLPLFELLIALLLIPLRFSVWGAWLALGLLLVFCAAMAVAMARGKSPDCHCFGQLHSEPVGPTTLIRNLILAGLAASVALLGPGTSALAWMRDLSTAEIAVFSVVLALLALACMQTWALFQMMRQNGRMLTRLDKLEAGGSKAPEAPAAPAGLPVGNDAPLFTLPSLTGESVPLSDLVAPGNPLLLFFTDPGCGPCSALLPEVARWDKEARPHFTTVLISRGTVEANREKLAGNPVETVLLQSDREVANSYQAIATPSAVMVESDGRIGSAVAAGADAIRSLVARTINAGLVNIKLKAGDAAPEFLLPDVTGKMVSSAEFRGTPTLLLFWNPTCGYCVSMLPDLKRWEAARSSKVDPQIVLVAAGSAEANKNYGLRSRVLLDESASVPKIFNANGTPTAILLDRDGRIISDVAIGGVAALELASSLRPNGKKPELAKV